MSGIVIERRIAGPAVKDVLDRISLSEDRVIELWYECGCRYLDRLSQAIRKHSVYVDLFFMVLKRDSFRKTPVSKVFPSIQESTVFWDWWARILKLICQECTDSIRSESDLKYYLDTFSVLPARWVIDEIFTKNN